MPAHGQHLIYESGGWEVDLARRELRRHGTPVAIGSRAFEIIEALAEAAGELVTKDQLIGRVWHGAIVEDNTLQVHISAVRKALGADRGMLKTAPRRGYRLLGVWTARPGGIFAGPTDYLSELLPVPTSTNFPVTAADLIGRAAAVQNLLDLVSAYRAVTLTGPGGIGKTVLAVEVARRLLPSFDGDGWLVELVSLSDPDLVASTVAGVLGLGLGGDQISAEAVARAVGGRKLLLVLDNCEHVIDAAAQLAETVVRLCPSTTVLATSREVLRIEGEFVYRVPSLEVPAEPQQEAGNPIEHSAVQLFIARTGALAPDFAPDAEHLPTIAAICRHLDGIPLAIELAAARAATLGVPQVAERLADRFGFLTVGRRTALPRHQTLRATLDWSYGLLPETERYLLRRLAVFAGGFTLESAAAVASDRVADVSSIVEGISNLVSKSLVTLIELAPVGRWRLLETIRAYALEKLAESGQANQAARRHAEFYRDLFAAAAPGSRLQPSTAEMIRFSREIDNVRAALDWCFSPTGEAAVGVILSAVCAPAWVHSALLAECHERTERALNHIDPALKLSASLQMQLHLALGLSLGLTMGSVERAKAALAKALELAESLDDSEAQLRALWGLWALHFNIGETRATQLIVEQFSRVAGDAGDQAAVLIGERLLGYTLQHAGQNRRAQECFEHVLELYVMRDRRYVLMLQLDQRVLARAMLARVLWLEGFADQAIAQARTSLEEAQATDYKLSICEALRLALCPVLLMTGDLAAGGRAVAMLIEVAERSNAAFWKILGRCLQGKLLIMRGEFSAGAALLRAEFDASERSGWAIWQPEFMGALAEGLAGLGRLGEALATVDQALAKANAGGERYYVPELLRIKGELLLQDTGDECAAAAENCFDRALTVAREQGARFWELRGALSLARLKTKQDRPDEARQILAPVYDRFTEGFETADLRAARAMLEPLPSLGVGYGR